MNDGFLALVTALISTAYVVLSLVFTTPDHKVISHCKDKGWHNFGQTRIICSVEPEKK